MSSEMQTVRQSKDKEPKTKKVWREIGGIVGLVSILGVVIAYVALRNQGLSDEMQDMAQATLIAISDKQLHLQETIAVASAKDTDSRELRDLEATLDALSEDRRKVELTLTPASAAQPSPDNSALAISHATSEARLSATSTASPIPVPTQATPTPSTTPLPPAAPTTAATATPSYQSPASFKLTGAVEHNLQLRKNTEPYVVEGAWTIGANSLVLIDPGVVIKFSDDSFIDVFGSLVAEGTLDEPIVFTSIKDDTVAGDTNGDGEATSAHAGDWTMIRFRDTSNDSSSVIEHALVRFAGEHRGGAFGAIQLEAASPKIRANEIADSLSFAVSADPNSFPVLEGNRIHDNGGNGLEIRGGELSSAAGVWSNTDVVYAISGPMTIRQGAQLKIAPSVIIKLAEDCFIDVYGALNATGEKSKEPVLSSMKDDTLGGDTNGDGDSSAPMPGDWTMIRFFDSSNDRSSVISDTIIRYAGVHRGTLFGAIHLESASPRIYGNLIEASRGYAISADVFSFPEVQGNQFVGNGGNGLEIRGGTMAVSGSWSNRDVVYVLTGAAIVGENSTLVIGPGVMVKLADDAFIDVFGTLKIQGTSAETVTFTSLRDDYVGGDTNADSSSSSPAAGDWTMIRFQDSSNDRTSLIEHAEIRYAGEHRGASFGAIHLVRASPTLKHNAIKTSHWYAISGDPDCFPKTQGNILDGNLGNGLEIRDGATTVSGAWDNTDMVYVVTGRVEIGRGTTLGIKPGVTVKFHDDGHTNIYGSLRAEGTRDRPIVFTSIRDDTQGGDTNNDLGSSAPVPGDWTALQFLDESNDQNCVLDNVIIRYAGEHRGNRYGAVHLISASPSIRNSIFEDNAYYGIWAGRGSKPTDENNTFARNTDGNVFYEQ